MIDLLPIYVRLIPVNALLLQMCIHVFRAEVEVSQLAPHPLLSHQGRHEIPRGRRSLQVSVVGQSEDDLADAFLEWEDIKSIALFRIIIDYFFTSGRSWNFGATSGPGSRILIAFEIASIRVIVCTCDCHRLGLPSGFPQHFFSSSRIKS